MLIKKLKIIVEMIALFRQTTDMVEQGGANASNWLRDWVQHNFRRTQLPPSTEENIRSLGTAVQHNFRRTLLVPSREESISSLGTAAQHNFQAHATTAI